MLRVSMNFFLESHSLALKILPKQDVLVERTHWLHSWGGSIIKHCRSDGYQLCLELDDELLQHRINRGLRWGHVSVHL